MKKKSKTEYASFTIFGDRVQGVGFRPFLLDAMSNFSLFGHAFNLVDGNVFVEVWGFKESILDFVEFLKTHKPEKASDFAVAKFKFGSSKLVRSAVMNTNLGVIAGQISKGVDVQLESLKLQSKSLAELKGIRAAIR